MYTPQHGTGLPAFKNVIIGGLWFQKEPEVDIEELLRTTVASDSKVNYLELNLLLPDSCKLTSVGFTVSKFDDLQRYGLVGGSTVCVQTWPALYDNFCFTFTHQTTKL